MKNTQLYMNPEKPYGFELAAQTLKKNGIDTIFCLPGNATVPFLASAGNLGMTVVTCRSEYGAVLAATGYAMRTGKVGLACLTAGYAGIASYGMTAASFGNVPVVVLEGASDSRAYDLRPQHELDQIPIAKASYCKAAYHCTHGERIPQMLTWAIEKAKSGVPGAVFIDISQDLMKSHVDIEQLAKFQASSFDTRSYADPSMVKKAAQLLASASKPAIVVGRLGVYAGIEKELKELEAHTGIPFDASAGYLADCDRVFPYLGTANQADVVLLIGKQSMGLKPEASAADYTGKIISIYPDTSDFGHAYPVEIGLAGDVKQVMEQLVEAVKALKFPKYDAWVAQLQSAKAAFKGKLSAVVDKHKNDVGPIHPAVMADIVTKFMVNSGIIKDATLGVDAGDSMVYYILYGMVNGVKQQFPQQLVSLLSMQNSAAIGMGLALGLGAGMADKNKLVFFPVVGDGSIGYHLSEIETMARENIPALILVSNNSCWGMVYNDQRRIWGRNNKYGGMLGKENAPVHYEKACEGLGGINGGYIEKSADLLPALEKGYKLAMEKKVPVMINVVTDPYIYNNTYVNWTLPATDEGEPYNGFGEA